jgi:ribosome maturation factor RimP
MTGLSLQDRIAEIILPTLHEMGYELVQVRLIESGRRTLQIMAERQDGRNMSVDDCAEISHQLSAVLDVEDPITGAYALEISSAGIDRPLVKLADFARYAGFEMKLETRVAQAGRKRFKGKILGVEGEDILIETPEKERIAISHAMVQSAKLILTDALIAWQGEQVQGEQAQGEQALPRKNT